MYPNLETNFISVEFKDGYSTSVPSKLETKDEIEWMQPALSFAFERGRSIGRLEIKQEFKKLFSIV